jgi:hemoglobin-like flavoprotein
MTPFHPLLIFGMILSGNASGWITCSTITLWRDDTLGLLCYDGGMKNDRQFYQIMINGQLDARWSAWFDGLIITWCDVTDGDTTVRQTMLAGYMPDQPALYGMLNKIRDLNLELVAVTRCTPPRRTLHLTERVSSEQIVLVQQSFAQARSQDARLAKLFYGRLFELDSSLRSLFHGDSQEQERKFMAMLVMMVNGLPHLEMLLPVVQGLGHRHVTYGVQAEHYALVEKALLWALAQRLGENFTPAVVAAWRAAYALLSEVMRMA